jgi:hypothetical protein
VDRLDPLRFEAAGKATILVRRALENRPLLAAPPPVCKRKHRLPSS